MADEENSGDTNVIFGGSDQYPLIIRAIWFIVFGWWASGIWLGIAWFLLITIVGIPIGFWMINRVTFVLSLKKTNKTMIVSDEDGNKKVEFRSPDQINLLVRAGYFFLIGWWFSLLWMIIAWLMTLSILGFPVAIWMYHQLPFVTTLYKHK